MADALLKRPGAKVCDPVTQRPIVGLSTEYCSTVYVAGDRDSLSWRVTDPVMGDHNSCRPRFAVEDDDFPPTQVWADWVTLGTCAPRGVSRSRTPRCSNEPLQLLREYPGLFWGCSSPEQGLNVSVFKDPKSGLYFVVLEQRFNRCGGPSGRVLDWWHEYAVTAQGEVVAEAPPMQGEAPLPPAAPTPNTEGETPALTPPPAQTETPPLTPPPSPESDPGADAAAPP